MALFTDKKELSRQAEYVPMETATGLRKVGLSALGYKADGSLNTIGKIQEYNPQPFHGLRNLGAQAFAKKGSDYSKVIKEGSGDAWTQDLNSVDFAWQAFKIYLAAGGSVGGGGSAAPAGATSTPTTGAAVTSGASSAPAGAGTAVQGLDTSTSAFSGMGSGTEIASGLGTDMTTTAAASAIPTYDVASWTTGTAMDGAGNIVDKNILDEINSGTYDEIYDTEETNMMDRFLEYMGQEDDGKTSGITPGGEEYDIISPDVMGRKGSGTGEGTGVDLDSKRPGSTFVDKLDPNQKQMLNKNLDQAKKEMSKKDKKNADADYANWKAAAEQQGLKVIGTDAVDNTGQVQATFNAPDDSAENKKRSGDALKNMAMGGIVSSGANLINTATSNINDAEDRVKEYQNQASMTTSYLL